VFRLHDHKHKKSSDPVLFAITERLGWNEYKDSSDNRIFNIPETKLAELLVNVKSRLECNYLRYLGDTDTLCSRAGVLVGSPGGAKQIMFIEHNDLDVLICGEVSEWDVTEYIKDSVFHGISRSIGCNRA